MYHDITASFRSGELELHVDLGSEAGAVIRCLKDGRIALYGIPLYGGEERFEGYAPTVNAALETALAWT